jgi:hypothetical protein
MILMAGEILVNSIVGKGEGIGDFTLTALE